jgi:glutamate synthase domain-containing protein 2
MNLQQPNANEATQTANRSRSVAPVSGICTRCVDGCRGNCEVFKASFRGREVLYPGPFGTITAGGDKDYPVDYSHVNIMGYAMGAKGLPEGTEPGPDTTLFPLADTQTQYGTDHPVKLRVPVFTGALGSTEIARVNWEHFATGAAVAGITLVTGENVCGIDPQLERDDNGKVIRSPEMERRVELFKRYYDGYGDMLVQVNVEDTRLGVAEYVIKQLGVECVELKWGQGAKCIGGEIQVHDLERAQELQRRGYLVTPDPSDHDNQAAFADKALKHFERHSRLGFIDRDEFMQTVQKLRDLGAKRVTLKTGAYGMRELAMAIRWASDAKLDLLTIDGAPGGTGMSPWRMMEEWGIPTFYLQCMAIEMADKLAQAGKFVPDLAMAGGFSSEDHVFKVLSMGSPYFKAVCMGRALMIPGMVGKNIQKWIDEKDLPKTISQFGSTREEIFIGYETLVDRYGKETAREMPFGAVAMHCFCDKLRTGLQQLMAGSRNFRVDTVSRDDVFALTEDAAKVSKLPYVMDVQRDEAMAIIEA